MPKIGFSNLVFFPLDGDDKEGTPVTYGEPVKVSEAITGGFTPQTSEASLYADDTQTDYHSQITGYDISLNTRDLTPDVEAKLLGYKVDKNGGVLRERDATAPYGALAFKSKLSDGTYEYNIIYKVKFSPVTRDHQTQGESIEFQTPTITGRGIPRMSDGALDYSVRESETNKTALATWFDDVYEFVDTVGGA